ncbi:Hematological and neurological expressed 1 protein [Lonchura striata]|uniref:Hematological and neurological expressed 1 protein n=1 Tax=Lonchura striata TaxID=40157 RepID=A0A218UV87_9PASE|nr:Hematological and neurological expressed 1 protein [Lonchura striata domestica]
MTTTATFSGMDPNGRNSSRVLRPPGGGSNFSLGFDEPQEQPVRRNKMASSIFGTPEENPPSWAKASGAKPGETRDSCESSGPQRTNSTEANCGDFVDPKVSTWLQRTWEEMLVVTFLELSFRLSQPNIWLSSSTSNTLKASFLLENTEADVEAAPGQSEEKSLPAAPVPSPVAPAPAPSRRNPPGGKSSLVLG